MGGSWLRLWYERQRLYLNDCTGNREGFTRANRTICELRLWPLSASKKIGLAISQPNLLKVQLLNAACARCCPFLLAPVVGRSHADEHCQNEDCLAGSQRVHGSQDDFRNRDFRSCDFPAWH